MSGSRNLALDGEVVQEGFDLLRTEEGRVLFLVEEDELANPVSVGLLSPEAEMSATTDDGNLVQKTGRFFRLLTP